MRGLACETCESDAGSAFDAWRNFLVTEHQRKYSFHLRKSEACLTEDTRYPSPLSTPVPLAPPPSLRSTQPLSIPTMTDTSFSTTVTRGLLGAGRVVVGRPSAMVPGARLVTTASTRSSVQESSSLGHSDLSFDEDSAVSVTSSTSGYRETFSLLMMPMEISSDDTIKRSVRVGATGSTTTVAGDSPDRSSYGNTFTTPTGDGETTALLGPGYSDSHSQHSLLMVFDEDTLI